MKPTTQIKNLLSELTEIHDERRLTPIDTPMNAAELKAFHKDIDGQIAAKHKEIVGLFEKFEFAVDDNAINYEIAQRMNGESDEITDNKYTAFLEGARWLRAQVNDKK